MAKYEKIIEKTPNGGSYSEIYYFDRYGNNVDESVANRCLIRECADDGTLINETWGLCERLPGDVIVE